MKQTNLESSRIEYPIPTAGEVAVQINGSVGIEVHIEPANEATIIRRREAMMK